VADDPYTVLEIPKDATEEQIKTAYRKLANKYHPDKVLHLGEEFRKLAEKRFKEIQKAYQELVNK
jgi:DnaJ like chaperone protein